MSACELLFQSKSFSFRCSKAAGCQSLAALCCAEGGGVPLRPPPAALRIMLPPCGAQGPWQPAAAAPRSSAVSLRGAGAAEALPSGLRLRWRGWRRPRWELTCWGIVGKERPLLRFCSVCLCLEWLNERVVCQWKCCADGRSRSRAPPGVCQPSWGSAQSHRVVGLGQRLWRSCPWHPAGAERLELSQSDQTKLDSCSDRSCLS